MIRLGLVGYGYRADMDRGGRGSSLYELSANGFDDVTPAAICDYSPAALTHAAKIFPESTCYDDYETMIAEAALDAVIIATPATYHADLACQALARGIHVLSEIPSVTSHEEAAKLWAAEQASDAIYMTGSNTNFRGYIDTAVDLQRRDLLGEPVYLESEYIHDLRELYADSPWRTTYEPIRYCTHGLGPLLRLIDDDIVTATCFGTGRHLPDTQDDKGHDFMAALFRTASNVVIKFTASFANEAGLHYWNYRVFTTKGIFERTGPAYTSMKPVPAECPRTLFYSKDLPLTNNRVELPIGDMPAAYVKNPKAKGHGGIDFAMLDAWFQAIRDGAPSPLSLREGLRMSLPGISAAESAKQNGTPVTIRYPWS